jgi:4-hydroxy-tetrahydrodipicolinate synthase
MVSGEDGTALGYNAHGGQGCISVTANVAPRLCAEFQAACAAGDFARARGYQDRLMPLHDALFCETSPAPIKYAVSLLGKCSDSVRLPLVEASEAARVQVKAAMQRAGLIN